jgi:hypothetical protein
MDELSSWFDFIISEPMELHAKGEVFIRFADVENRFWKGGLMFDYVELLPVTFTESNDTIKTSTGWISSGYHSLQNVIKSTKQLFNI